MGTFKDQWISYRDGVVPEHAEDIQFQETQKAFYGGGVALFNLVVEAGANFDLEALDRLKEEFQRFGDYTNACLILDAIERKQKSSGQDDVSGGDP